MYVGFMQHTRLARMIFIRGIILPELVIMRVNPLDPCLNNCIAARKARKFCHVNSRALEAATNSSRIHDCIEFRMADDSKFLGCIKQNILVIVHTSCEAIETGGKNQVIF